MPLPFERNRRTGHTSTVINAGNGKTFYDTVSIQILEPHVIRSNIDRTVGRRDKTYIYNRNVWYDLTGFTGKFRNSSSGEDFDGFLQ
jgi:hypothetical protein